MSGRVVVIGSLNADLVARVSNFPRPGETVTGTSFAVFPGGKGANQACAAARLGATVHMIGRVGDDSNGRLLTRSLEEAGVDTGRVTVDPQASTGTALITIDGAGQNEIVVVPGANGAVSAEDIESHRDLVAQADLVLLQLEIPMAMVETAARLARQVGTATILDPAPARPEALALLPWVDWVTPNETELAALVRWSERGAEDEVGPDGESGVGAARADPGAARLLLARGARRVVAKLGAGGARLVTGDREISWPAFPVEALDTTAAGDVWNGAFAAALSTGMRLEAAGRFANAAAALSVTRPGAQPGMPTRAEVEELLAGNP